MNNAIVKEIFDNLTSGKQALYFVNGSNGKKALKPMSETAANNMNEGVKDNEGKYLVSPKTCTKLDVSVNDYSCLCDIAESPMYNDTSRELASELNTLFAAKEAKRIALKDYLANL